MAIRIKEKLVFTLTPNVKFVSIAKMVEAPGKKSNTQCDTFAKYPIR